MRKFDPTSSRHSLEAKNPRRALDFARNICLNSDGCGQEMATQVVTKLKFHISTNDLNLIVRICGFLMV